MNETHQILILVTRGGVGGAQVSVLNLARELSGRGYMVTVGFGDGQFLERECLADGLSFIRFSSLRRGLNPFRGLWFAWQIKRLSDAEKYQVLHINSSNALLAALGAKLSRRAPKVVFTFRGLSVLDSNYRQSWVRRLYQPVFKFLLGFVDEAVFVSRANYQTARDQGLIRSGRVIYNGLDPKRLLFLEGGRARDELARLTDRELTGQFLVGSIGRLAYQKNYRFLLEQAAKLVQTRPELLVLIIGDGPQRPELEKLIGEYQLENSVVLMGEIPNASRYLPAFEVFVLPSRYEGMSVTLLETLFAGVPVLTSAVGGAVEQFSHAPFQVYPLGDGESFRERLTRLIDNPEIRRELSAANQERSNDFTIDRVAREYLEAYQENN